jgi:hypothetical protein
VPRLLVFLILSADLLPAAGDGCAVLREAKESTYGFSPSSLSTLEKTAKIIGLDRFWKLAKADPKQSSGCLLAMLEKERTDSFFLFDGSQLLFTLDKSTQAAEAIAGALAKVDLNDVKPYDYAALAIDVSKAGARISSAAMNFVSARHVDEYEPGNGVLMNRERGVAALFGRLPVEEAVVKGKALYESGDSATAPYGLLILALALTPDAMAIVNQAGDISGLPAPIRRQISSLISRTSPRAQVASTYNRKQLQAILKSAPNYRGGFPGPSGNEEFLTSAFSELQPEDAPLVREARRQSIVDPSAASLLQYYAYTHILLVMQTKAGIFVEPAPPVASSEPVKAPTVKKKRSPSRHKTRKGRK